MNKEKVLTLLQYLIPQHSLSILVGKLATTEIVFIKNIFIKYFLKKYDIDMKEALEQDAFAYKSFNDFFTRSLKPDARPIDNHADALISPVDGKISQIGNIEAGQLIQAKGLNYSLLMLLAGKQELAENFYGGKFATIYLSPSNYHKIHMPLTAKLKQSIFVPGKLFSVNSATTENRANLFSKNERLICVFEDEQGKEFALILVGAMIVGSIETIWSGQITPKAKKPQVLDMQVANKIFVKGEEIAKFKLGSTVILLTPKNYNTWNSDILVDDCIKLGKSMGKLCA